MRFIKVFISLVLIGLTAFCWYSTITSYTEKASGYKKYFARAELSYKEGLYQDAYENYSNALNLNRTETVTDKQIEACRMYYEEEALDSYEARRQYLTVLINAWRSYPDRLDYAIAAVELYLKGDEYTEAKKLCEQVLTDNPKNQDIINLREEIIRSYTLDYNYFIDYKEGADGYYSVTGGKYWFWISADGLKQSQTEFETISSIGPEGLYYAKKEDNKGKFYDVGGVARGIVKKDYLDIGVYMDGLCPVQKTNKKWTYVDLDGNEYFGEFDTAGGFSDGRAAVRKGESWYLINREGKKINDSDFTDIKLDMRGCCYVDGFMTAARKEGQYSIWDSELKQVGEFRADNIDIPTAEGLVAFEQDGKWGFVNLKGEVVIQPAYQTAKSFTNGMAAVCRDDMWGYIRRDGEEIVEPQFRKAGYVNASGSAMISDEEEYYRLLLFRFSDDLKA